MTCKKPFNKGIVRFGCGQCIPCRISRRRLWTNRLTMEGYMHGDSTFVTLTYDPERVPSGGTLVPKHATDFIKRLRQKISPHKIRYYLVGEYGDETQRPHYHAAIFGLPRYADEVIREAWGMGHVHCGDLSTKSAAYIAGYVTKKMTSADDPRLKGRHPEFARMSLRPGIGALSLQPIVDVMTTDAGANELNKTGDVPSVIRHNQKKWPLGRYLKKKLRQMYGFEEDKTPQEKIDQWHEEMCGVHEEAQAHPEGPVQGYVELSHHKLGKIQSVEGKSKIFKKKGTL